jgi:branched-chain amino acid transport system substrate-binding protein
MVLRASLLAALLGAASALSTSPMTALAADPPYPIPALLPITGPAAFIGKASQDTLQRLETAVNRAGGIKGRPIHFEVYDTQGSPQIAVQLVNQLTAKQTSAVLGPVLTNECLAVAPFVQTKIVQYCISPGVDPAKGSYSFSANVSAPAIFDSMVHYFHARGWNRIATLTTADATGQLADERLVAEVSQPENKGTQIVAQEHFAPADLTVAAQLSKIKAANPQVLVAWAIGTPFVTVLRGLGDAGYNIPIAASNAGMTYEQMKQWGPYLPQQLYFTGTAYLAGITPPALAKPLQQFYSVTKDVGVKPDMLTGLIWDPALIVVSALQQLGTSATAEQIHSYIEGLKNFPGIFGVYDFSGGDQRGIGEKTLFMMRWDAQKNTWTTVSGVGGVPL